MSKVTKRGPKSPEMNMTPMIDVTFQLIIFFMLVNNIIAEETVQLIVPRLDDSQTRQMDEGNRITVNVAPQDYTKDDRQSDNPLQWSGLAKEMNIGGRWFQFAQIDEAVEFLKSEKKRVEDRGAELEVVLRADAALYYEEVQPVMSVITSAGIAKVNMMAFLNEDKKKPQE